MGLGSRSALLGLWDDRGACSFGTQNAAFPGQPRKELQQRIIPPLAAAVGWVWGVVCLHIMPGLWSKTTQKVVLRACGAGESPWWGGISTI